MTRHSRRDFIQYIGSTGLLLCFRPDLAAGQDGDTATEATSAAKDIFYKYKTVPLSRLKDLKVDMDRILDGDLASDNETFRSYVSGFNYELPEEFPEARSIIVIALPDMITRIDFNYQGTKHRVSIPPGYVINGPTMDEFLNSLRTAVTGNMESRFEFTPIPLKLLSARTGLGQYGKNNILFVDEMGSYISLMGFYTEHEFQTDDWQPVRMLHICKGCDICIKECPTKAIREDNFVIDVGKCVTLYNERSEPMPDYIPPEAHNCLVGCLKCQYPCPANKEFNSNIDQMPDITEAETEMLLTGASDQELEASIKTKLARVGLQADLAHLGQNLKLLIPT